MCGRESGERIFKFEFVDSKLIHTLTLLIPNFHANFNQCIALKSQSREFKKMLGEFAERLTLTWKWQNDFEFDYIFGRH